MCRNDGIAPIVPFNWEAPRLSAKSVFLPVNQELWSRVSCRTDGGIARPTSSQESDIMHVVGLTNKYVRQSGLQEIWRALVTEMAFLV